MQHPAKVWTDPVFEEEQLSRLFGEWLRRINAGPSKLSAATVRKYRQDTNDLLRGFERMDIRPVLGSLTADNVAAWAEDMERRGLSPSTVAGRVISIKVFTNRFVFRELELTELDLLRKVRRPSPPVEAKEVLTEEERERLLASYDRDTLEDVRERALMACFMATGMRSNAIRTLRLAEYDRVTGEFTTVEKGQVTRIGQLSPRAMRYMRTYLERRPKNAITDQIWVTDAGRPLTKGGLEMVFRRAKRRSGIPRLHAHLLRHGKAQYAADRDVPVEEIQTILGHKTPAMARRYAGRALDRQGARLMAQYSPIG